MFISSLLLGVVLFALGYVPLLGGPRYEAALLAGVIAPGWAAIATANSTLRGLLDEGSLSGRDLRQAASKSFLAHGLSILVAATGHGLRLGWCEPLPGYAFLLLGPVLGTLLGVGWGSFAGIALLRWFRLRRSAGGKPPRSHTLAVSLAAASGPIVTALWAGWEFYSSAAVFAFDPFAGHFSGPLYDTPPFDFERLLLFRAGSALTVLSALAASASLRVQLTRSPQDVSCRRAVFGYRSSSPLALSLSLLAASMIHMLAQPHLHLATSDASIAGALDGRVRVADCSVMHSPRVSHAQAATVARECAGHLVQLRRFFGQKESEPVLVLLFADEDEKWRLTGARTTSVAKPWRREIYIQLDSYPHPVLGHELAHVLSGDLGQGPLALSGPLGGWIPDPGRIEGIAVAAAPRENEVATVRELAGAMLQVGKLPTPSILFSLSFYTTSAPNAYVAAGAFVQFVREKWGAPTLAAWYRGGQLPTLTDSSWSELDRRFNQWLTQKPVSPDVLARAGERFSQPAVFGRRCPHAAARALVRARGLCRTSPRGAEAAITNALRYDGHRVDASTWIPGCSAAAGATGRAREQAASTLLRPELGDRARASLLELSADLAWARGESEGARRGYERLARLPLQDVSSRRMRLKMWALQQPDTMGNVLRSLLAQPRTPFAEVAATLGRIEAEQGATSGVASYLLGVNLATMSPERARRHLSLALQRPLPFKALRQEALRRLIVVECESGRPDSARQALNTLLSDASTEEMTRLQLTRLVERCQLFPEPIALDSSSEVP